MNEHPHPSSDSEQRPDSFPKPSLPLTDASPAHQPPSSPPPFFPEDPSPSTSTSHEPPANPVIQSGKAVLLDAVSVVKWLHKDPTRGLQSALTALGDERAFKVGVFLGSLLVFCSWGAAWRVSNDIVRLLTFSLSSFATGSDFRPQLSITDHLKVIIVSALPVLAVVGVFLAIQRLFKSPGNGKQMVFITGICFLPVALLQLLIMVFGAGNIEILLILMLVAFTTTVLLLNISLIEVLRLSARTAMLLVPVILLVVFYVQKILLETILTA